MKLLSHVWELYQGEPVLWDPKHGLLKKKKKKINNAWIRISEILKITVQKKK